MSLLIVNGVKEFIFNEIDTDGEIEIVLTNNHAVTQIYINFQDAKEIIAHLKKQFEL